jgi:uncharacterized protein YecE (DUF72 family)
MSRLQEIRIGTSGFSYPGPPPAGWYGAVYPNPKPKGFDELKYYSGIFSACEINQTFYRPPTAKITAAWAEKTPPDFVFSLKLWQKFTHPMKISRKKSDEPWEAATQQDFDEFRAGILPLANAGKLGALLLQYPTGFHYTPANLEQLEATLRMFYDYRRAVEFRHKSWSENRAETTRLLEEYRASEVLIDEPRFSSSIRQEAEAIGDIVYFRAHGRNAKAWWRPKESWERYDYLYSRAEIKKHAERIKTAAAKPGVKAVFGLYNNHARGNAAANAVMLSQELELKLKAMPAEGMLAQFPEMVQTPGATR